jgi:hypothetical protein
VRRLALLLVIAGVGVAVWLLSAEPAPPIAALPVAEAPAPPAVIDAGAAPVAIPPRDVVAGPVTFSDGFCSTDGNDGFETRFTLEALVNGRLRALRDGGDTGERAALLEGSGHRESPVVLEHLRQAAAQFPESPYVQVAIALAAQAQDLQDEKVAALRRAKQRLPDDPALGLAIALATRNDGDQDDAIAGLTAFLAVDPKAGASQFRARLEVQRDIQHGYRRRERDGITVLWPGDAISDREVDEIAVTVDRGLDDAAAFTGTKRRQRLTVVIYPSKSEMLAVSCAQKWTQALYDGTLRLVAEKGGVDSKMVRHETFHAQVTPSAWQAPKWFQEGAAQSFAGEDTRRRTWKMMVANRSWIPFSSLEGSFQIFSSSADAELAYAQSLAMVEMMRELGGDRSVATAVSAFQSGADTPTALARACGRPEVTGADLLQFLERRLKPR